MHWHFILLLILTAATYQLGFARRLPLLKTVIVYFALLIGTIPLAILDALGLPMIPALSVAIVILLVARYRAKMSGSEWQREQ
ncbi:YlaH-like family protein [Aneurinibacillus terranovensis]|uniref:YlaH-like family protein n=1 Tax=Aneurinibacillus terranovensis TaxID=278991 RepID=UPI0003F8098A|nr:YlaH-like family protein [Aneurinibacillus terranovensis]